MSSADAVDPQPPAEQPSHQPELSAPSDPLPADNNTDISIDNANIDSDAAVASHTTPPHSPSASPAAPSSPLTSTAATTPPPARASHFFTPTKSTQPSAASSSPAPSAHQNGHAATSHATSTTLPPTTSSTTSTPFTSRDKPPLPKTATATPSTARSSHGTRSKGSSLDVDPLMHPLQSKGAAALDDENSEGSATPSHSPSVAPSPLATSASASDLYVASTSLPPSSPAHSTSAATASSFTSVVPSVAATPTSAAVSSSVSFSATTPIASSSSTGGLSSWFSSFSSSSFSRDVALISTPPALFDNYYNELPALLHVLQQHPPPNLPASVTELQEKLSTTAPSSSAHSAALSDHDSRRKLAATYNTSPAKKRLVRLQKLLSANDSFIMDMKHLILKARRKCDTGHDALLAIVERLRVCFWMNEFNLLQEGMHLQDELFDNYEDMCKACIRTVKEKTKELQQLVEQLNSSSAAAASTAAPLNEFFFLSPRQLALLCPALPEMLQRQSDLATRLGQVKVEYVAVAKVTEEEEKVSRNDRIVRVIDDFYNNYNGDLTADYSPARALEYEFTRNCLDERCKEGQLLNKWMATTQQQARAQLKDSGSKAASKDSKDKERVTHRTILHFVRKFESNFVRDYGIAASRRLFLRLLIQRMLFPRIWDVCVTVEDSESDTREKDDKFVAQAEWLRCIGLEQLGVPAAFLMPEQVKVAVSSRWSKRQGQQQDGAEEDVGGARVPRVLPAALQGLLHPEERKTEDSGNHGGRTESASVAAVVDDDGDEDDEFGRQFIKGSGGRKKKTATGDNLFARFDDDSKAAADLSPSFSPSPSVASPLSKSVSSNSLSTSAPLSSTPPVASTSPPVSSAVPTLPTSGSNSALATSTPARSSHAVSTSSSSPAAPSSTTPSAPLATRVAELKARYPPLPNRLRPYLSCIDVMEEITHLTCPLDMLQCLLAVARNIYKTANEYSLLNCPPAAGSKKAELGADSFFPILLYVIIQSDVKDMHRRLRFMQEYGLGKTKELEELNYYCTCVEGGVNYVMNAQPEEY